MHDQNALMQERFKQLEEKLSQIDFDLREQTRRRVQEIAQIYDHFEKIFDDLAQEILNELKEIDAKNEEEYRLVGLELVEYEKEIAQEQQELEKEHAKFVEDTREKI